MSKTHISVDFVSGTPITQVDLSCFSGNQGLRDCVKIRVIGATIKITGSAAIPPVVYLTCNHHSIFPQIAASNGPSFRGIPILLHPELVGSDGNTWCSGEPISSWTTDTKCLPQNLKFALSLPPASPLGMSPPQPWHTSKVLDVAGDSTVLLEITIIPGAGGFGSMPGAKSERFNVIGGYSSNF